MRGIGPNAGKSEAGILLRRGIAVPCSLWSDGTVTEADWPGAAWEPADDGLISEENTEDQRFQGPRTRHERRHGECARALPARLGSPAGHLESGGGSLYFRRRAFRESSGFLGDSLGYRSAAAFSLEMEGGARGLEAPGTLVGL